MNFKYIFTLFCIHSIRCSLLFAQGGGTDVFWQAPPGSISHIVSVPDSFASGTDEAINLRLPSGSHWLDGSHSDRTIQRSELPAVQTVCKNTGTCDSILLIPDSSYSHALTSGSERPEIGNFQPLWLPVINAGVSHYGAFNTEVFGLGVLNRLFQWARPGDEEPHLLEVTLQTASAFSGLAFSGLTFSGLTLPLQPLIEVTLHGKDIIPKEDRSIVRLLVRENRKGFKLVVKPVSIPRLYLKENELYETSVFASEDEINLSDDLVAESENDRLWYLYSGNEELIEYLEQVYKGRVVEIRDSSGNIIYMIYKPDGKFKKLTQLDAQKKIEADRSIKMSIAEDSYSSSLPEGLKLISAGGGGEVNMDRLLDDMRAFAADWERVAYGLRFNIYEVNAINKDTKGVHDALKRVLEMWVDKGANWDVFLSAIKKINTGYSQDVVRNYMVNHNYYMLEELPSAGVASAVHQEKVVSSTGKSTDTQLHGDDEISRLKAQNVLLQDLLKEKSEELSVLQQRNDRFEREKEQLKIEKRELVRKHRNTQQDLRRLQGRIEIIEKQHQKEVNSLKMQLASLSQSAQDYQASYQVNDQPQQSVSHFETSQLQQNSYLQQEVEMYVLIEAVNPSIKYNWEEVAFVFKISDIEVQSWKRDHNTNDCMMAMWSALTGRNKLGTYEQLFAKLKQVTSVRDNVDAMQQNVFKILNEWEDD